MVVILAQSLELSFICPNHTFPCCPLTKSKVQLYSFFCLIAKSFVVPSSAVMRSVIPSATASLSASSAPPFNTDTVAVSATVMFAFISFTVVGFFSV